MPCGLESGDPEMMKTGIQPAKEISKVLVYEGRSRRQLDSSNDRRDDNAVADEQEHFNAPSLLAQNKATTLMWYNGDVHAAWTAERRC